MRKPNKSSSPGKPGSRKRIGDDRKSPASPAKRPAGKGVKGSGDRVERRSSTRPTSSEQPEKEVRKSYSRSTPPSEERGKRNTNRRPGTPSAFSRGERRDDTRSAGKTSREDSRFPPKPSSRTDEKFGSKRATKRPGSASPFARREKRDDSRRPPERTSREDSRFPPKSRTEEKSDERRGRRPGTASPFARREKRDDSRQPPERTSRENSRFPPKSTSRPIQKSYSERTGKRPARPVAKAPSTQIRLNKYIANSGVCSRRDADEFIRMGLISVNGKVVSELGYKVNPGDVVRYEDRLLKAEKPVYLLMNKPKGYITTTEDPQERKTVMQIIGSSVKERVYPVGRLDRNTTGLLLLTNDGEMAERLMHPSFNVRKIYKVELDKPLTRADFQKIQEGVMLPEGKANVDDIAVVSEDRRTVGLELHIGWNRIVRRIFETLGYEIIKLDRTIYAGLTKKDLKRGQWRYLTNEEIIRLKHFI